MPCFIQAVSLAAIEVPLYLSEGAPGHTKQYGTGLTYRSRLVMIVPLCYLAPKNILNEGLLRTLGKDLLPQAGVLAHCSFTLDWHG